MCTWKIDMAYKFLNKRTTMPILVHLASLVLCLESPRAGLPWAVVEVSWIPFSTLMLTKYLLWIYFAVLGVLDLKNLRKHHPIWSLMKTCSTWDCLDDIHILHSYFQCTHVVFNIRNALHSLKLLVLRVSACGPHTAQWRMPNGFCFILSKFGVGDTLQIFLGIIGVRSQWRY